MPKVDSIAKAVTIVDDEPLVLDMLVRAANSWGYEVETASTGEGALLALERRNTPIVVTDLSMPGQGGVWLVNQIRRRWARIAIIVITAGQDTDAAVDCLNAGAYRYFLKPIKLDEFRHALDITLRTCELQHEHDRSHERLERTVRRQTQKIRRTFLSGIDSLVRTVEARDHYTSGHSMRVRQYSLRLADALKLDERLRRQLSLAAKLHDIGKVHHRPDRSQPQHPGDDSKSSRAHRRRGISGRFVGQHHSPLGPIVDRGGLLRCPDERAGLSAGARDRSCDPSTGGRSRQTIPAGIRPSFPRSRAPRYTKSRLRNSILRKRTDDWPARDRQFPVNGLNTRPLSNLG